MPTTTTPSAVSIDGVPATVAADPVPAPAPVIFADATDVANVTTFVPAPVQGVGPVQAFTSNATAATYDEARAAALAQADVDARNTLGPQITSENTFNSVNIKFNNDGTYTAEYTLRAQTAEAPVPEGPEDPAALDAQNVANRDALEAGDFQNLAPEDVPPEDVPYQPNLDNPLEGVVTQPADVIDPNELGAGVPPLVTAPGQDPTTETASIQQALRLEAQNRQTIADQRMNRGSLGDWRVRLRLAPRSNYLYNAPAPGILSPLKSTDGVIFPYTPTVNTSYKAQYDAYDLIHSNYRGYFYKNSYVDAINIKGVFTAQDTNEADYLLAVIHFFRSVTKMFYGQDALRGAPPPLVYLSGFGQYQFSEAPCVVSNFSYNLPADVNYIRAGSNMVNGNFNQDQNTNGQNLPTNPLSGALYRLFNAGMSRGAIPLRIPANAPPFGIDGRSTYVPTKMDIDITLLPMQSRSQVSQQFSLENFANGNFTKGGFW